MTAAPAPVAVSSRCQGCGACLLTCPTHAIRPHGDPLLVLADRCTGCLECLDVCPVDAIDLLPVDPHVDPHVDPRQERAS